MAENNIDKKIDAVVGEALEDAIENETPIDIEIVSVSSSSYINCSFWLLTVIVSDPRVMHAPGIDICNKST